MGPPIVQTLRPPSKEWLAGACSAAQLLRKVLLHLAAALLSQFLMWQALKSRSKDKRGDRRVPMMHRSLNDANH